MNSLKSVTLKSVTLESATLTIEPEIMSKKETYDILHKMTSEELYDFFKPYLKYPLEQMCECFFDGTSVTTIKQYCRLAGIKKWPGRKFKALLNCMENDPDKSEERKKYYDNFFVELEKDISISLVTLIPTSKRYKMSRNKAVTNDLKPIRTIVKKKKVNKINEVVKPLNITTNQEIKKSMPQIFNFI